MVYLGIITLTVSVMTNLFSHKHSARAHRKTAAEIRLGMFDYEKSIKRTRLVDIINYLNIGLLIIGISMLTIFFVNNLNGNKLKENAIFEQAKEIKPGPNPDHTRGTNPIINPPRPAVQSSPSPVQAPPPPSPNQRP